MKFLIFNVIVLCSLGYLLTSKPNENFNQWFSNTKDNEIKKIINDILEAKNKKLFKEKVKIDDREAYEKEKTNQKVEVSNKKFMSLDERENALAELIIDMELLHITTLK